MIQRGERWRHKNLRIGYVIFVLLSSFLSFAALAETGYDGWNTFTLEHYDVAGERSQGLYQNEGWQRHNDFGANFYGQYSPYQSMRGYVQGSANHSAYRGLHGGRLTSASLHYENGELGLPFRLDVGDFFATQSRRTLQRGLKGFQLEMQPGGASLPQSLQVFWGRSAQDYDVMFDDRKDYFYGASWLIESTFLGALSVSSVGYYDDGYQPASANDSSVGLGGNELVNSVAWYRSFAGENFTHLAELELAYLSGESQNNDSLNGTGAFFELSGYGGQGKNYLFSYERNNREFRPAGASVTADRETIDTQLGLPFYRGLNLRIRGQQYRDGFASDNALRTRIAGVNVAGKPLHGRDLTINADLAFRAVSNVLNSVNRDDITLNLNLAMPVNENWRNRMQLQWQETDDYVSDELSHRYLLSLGADFSHTYSGWESLLSPTVNINEELDGTGGSSSNVSMGVAFNTQKNGHSIELSHRQNYFDSDRSSGQDSDVGQSRFAWRSELGSHVLGASYDLYRYNRDADSAVDSYKATMYWTFKFEKPDAPDQTIVQEEASLLSFFALDDLRLNQVYDVSLHKALAEAGWSSAGQSGRFELFDGSLFKELQNVQTMVLEKAGSALRSANVLVAFSNFNFADNRRDYERVLDLLIKQYGAPIQERSVGEFTADWRVKLNLREFERVAQWTTSSGSLRFGIASSSFGAARMELQLTPSATSMERKDWGLNVAP
jgi:hypothetical protein